MRGIPEWLTQVVRGLRDGKGWFVRKLQNVPMPLRIGGWVLLQAVLFRIQPQLWRGVVTVLEILGEFRTLAFRTHLLFVVIGLIVVQTVAIMLKLISVEDGLKNVNSSTENPTETIADGGSNVTREEPDEGTSGLGGIGGGLAGAAFGSVFGPAGAIGFAVLGAMLGDEYERYELRRRHAIVHGTDPKE